MIAQSFEITLFYFADLISCLLHLFWLQLRSFGINKSLISSTHVTMESGNCICVREPASIAIFDMNMPTKPWMIDIKADSALMNPNSKILAVKGK